jgi:hypothetical protein
VDPESDRYPDAKKIVARVFDEEDYPDGPVERIEVTLLANGEATWRVWAARAEEARGGFYASSEG